MKYFLLINVKMPTTIVGILTFMSGKNSILGLSEPKKKRNFLIFFSTYEHLNYMPNSVEHENSFITSGSGLSTCVSLCDILVAKSLTYN